jgi:hypothetical protein
MMSGIVSLAVRALVCALAFASNSKATSMIGDVFVDVEMKTQFGKNLIIRSDGDRILYFRYESGGDARVIDVSFAKDLTGALINDVKIYLDGASGAVPKLTHVLIPFEEWRSVGYDELHLMLSFENVRLVRAAVIGDGDLDIPLYVFEN